MKLFQSRLEAPADRAQNESEAEDRWLRERAGIEPEERRAKFQAWVKAQIRKTFNLPGDEVRREKLVGQCANEITIMVRQLRGRGWLLDGEALAAEVTACLTPIGSYQRTGKVDDFWPYFRAGVRRYVGQNAERIQALARRTGADLADQSMGAIIASLGVNQIAKPAPISMTELVAEKTPPKKKPGRPRVADVGDQTMPLL